MKNSGVVMLAVVFMSTVTVAAPRIESLGGVRLSHSQSPVVLARFGCKCLAGNCHGSCPQGATCCKPKSANNCGCTYNPKQDCGPGSCSAAENPPEKAPEKPPRQQ